MDGARVRPLRADARRNHARVVAAAHEVFAEAGPEASLNEIARRADVGPGTLYRHFPTRRALQVAVLRGRIEALCGRGHELLTAGSADGALAEWLRAFLAHARSDQGLGGAVMAAGPDELGFDCHQRIMDTVARLATAHTDDAEEPDQLLGLVLDTIPRTR